MLMWSPSTDGSEMNVLNSRWFVSMQDAKREIEIWRRDYNDNRLKRLWAIGQQRNALLWPTHALVASTNECRKLAIHLAPNWRHAQMENGPNRVVPAITYQVTTNTTAFSIVAPSKKVVVLSEAYSKNNSATLNDKSPPVIRINHAFKGIAGRTTARL